MKDKRKRLVFQYKLTEQLQEQIKNLEKQNNLLIKENEVLKRLNDEQQKSIDVMQLEHQKAMQEYTDGINEINILKKKYREAIKKASLIKKEYSNKMSILLKEMCKHTK